MNGPLYINAEGYEPEIKSEEKPVFTCDKCLDKRFCPCAYDLYNTNGSCLMEK